MLITIAIIIALLVAAILAFATTRPNSFRVERSENIQASPQKLFAIISEFQQWDTWSPWEKLDSSMKKTHSGSPNGIGAVYEWEGNRQVGKGRMEITTTVPDTKITIRLDFFKPFEATNTTEFTLTNHGATTTVTWAMFGPSPYASKLMGLVFNMDRVVGKQFEEGLANLKAITEKT